MVPDGPVGDVIQPGQRGVAVGDVVEPSPRDRKHVCNDVIDVFSRDPSAGIASAAFSGPPVPASPASCLTYPRGVGVGYARGFGDVKEKQMRGYSTDRDEVLQRLEKIEGQVRGLKRMIDKETYCIDVLTQISATTKALQSVALLLLDDHLEHCVRDALASGASDASDKVAEASAAIARLVRS